MQDGRTVVGRWGTVGVAVLHRALDEAFFDALGATLDKIADDGDAAISALVVRASRVPGSMPPALREKAKRTLGKHQDRVSGFAYVLSGSGLKAKMVRAAMNAVMLAMPIEAKIFHEVAPAVRWLVTRPGQPATLAPTEAELIRAVEGMM